MFIVLPPSEFLPISDDQMVRDSVREIQTKRDTILNRGLVTLATRTQEPGEIGCWYTVYRYQIPSDSEKENYATNGEVKTKMNQDEGSKTQDT